MLQLLLIPVWLLLVQDLSGRDRAASVCTSAPRASLRAGEFRAMLDTVAHAWNTGKAEVAVECFTSDAVYIEPPDRQLYKGASALQAFFATSINPPRPDRMRWHFVAFDDALQTGFGEYTYRGRQFFHGIAVVQLQGGRIRRWREYQYASRVPWEDFVGPSR
jgi:hypothetical protein